MLQSAAIQVITLADNRYSLPLAVMVRSLLDCLETPREVCLTVIDGGISDASKTRLMDSWRGSPAFSRFTVRWVAPEYGNLGDIGEWGRIPKLTYARIQLNSYLPDESRVILLDSDTVVRTCIGKLWDQQLAGAVMAATVDPFIPTISSLDGLAGWETLGLPADTPYFNAGVMLVDLDLYRQMDAARLASQYAGKNWQISRFYDQDALNVVLAGRWTTLDARWQEQPRLARFLSSTPRSLDAWVLHFSGRLKPWIYSLPSDADHEFFDVLDRTQWAGSRPPRTMQSLLTECYERWFRRFLHPVEKRALNLLGSRARRKQNVPAVTLSPATSRF